ncbi:hypothetical protein [Nocardia cyriacigeorgica]|uniref:hypothetical protein n=2 Tax=Nocardia TaxID=1817 RepID=UPI00189327C1|nr:hypothetical protein [Nocardia cyriacigeorgica]MBF6163069.1 hypothetical protein [Nocardia cyriacigeorgica]MBF6202037.1 hypothetical protein [Nocardia cyriacigeorgica]
MSEKSEMDEITSETSRAAQRASMVVSRYISAARAKGSKAPRLSRSERKKMAAEVNQIMREERRWEEEEARRLREGLTQAISAHQQQVLDGFQPRVDESMQTWFTRQQSLAHQRHELERYIQMAPGLSMTERGTAVGSLRAAHFMPATKAPAPFPKAKGTAALKARVEAGLSRLRTGVATAREKLPLERWEQRRQEQAARENEAAREAEAAGEAEAPAAPKGRPAGAGLRHLAAVVSVLDALGRRRQLRHEVASELAAARWVDEAVRKVTPEQQVREMTASVNEDAGNGRVTSVYHVHGSRETVQADVEKWREGLEVFEREHLRQDDGQQPKVSMLDEWRKEQARKAEQLNAEQATTGPEQHQQQVPPEIEKQIETLNRQVDKVLAQNLDLREGMREAHSRIEALTAELSGIAEERDRYRGERDEAVQKLAEVTPAEQRYGSRERVRAQAKATSSRERVRAEAEASSNGGLAEEQVRDREMVGAGVSGAGVGATAISVEQRAEGNAQVGRMVGVSFGPTTNGTSTQVVEEEYEVPVIELTEEE